jgi:hypothetical protein
LGDGSIASRYGRTVSTERPPRFRDLQQRLRDLWPTVTPRSIGDVERTVVVCYSLTLEMPPPLLPALQAFEERFLCVVLTLLRSPRTRVIYLTSMPILPRLVDYWFSLVPELDTPQARRRLLLLSPVDPRPIPLTRKVLDRPGLVERVREAVPDPTRAFLLPFLSTELERELALRLGIPLYGPDPALAHLGTKSGSRRLFREAGVSLPAGVEGVHSRADVERAIRTIRAERHDLPAVVVKLDEGVSGYGNATIHLTDGRSIADAVADLDLVDEELDPDVFYASLEEHGGIVEELLVGEDLRSPSVQLRLGPDRTIAVISTHDQVLAGPQAQTFVGCRFPAETGYVFQITEAATRVGERLCREGVIGRLAVDFVAVRGEYGGWTPHALEINLRNGGTTHPTVTLQALTDGHYDAERGIFLAPNGREKCYFATDHLERPGYDRLTPDDFLDLLDESGLAWSVDEQVGVVFHMVSAIAVAGLVGMTAIAESQHEAYTLYRRARDTVDLEAARLSALAADAETAARKGQ